MTLWYYSYADSSFKCVTGNTHRVDPQCTVPLIYTNQTIYAAVFLFPCIGSVPFGASHPPRTWAQPSIKQTLPRRNVQSKVLQSNAGRAGHLHGNTPQPPSQETRSFVCYICGCIFVDAAKYREHQREHRNLDKLPPGQQRGDRFQCRFCPRRFSYRVYLVRHERSHTGEKPYACSICGKRFGLSSNLYQHERRYHGKVTFTTV